MCNKSFLEVDYHEDNYINAQDISKILSGKTDEKDMKNNLYIFGKPDK